MAGQQNTLSDVTQGTTELLHEATEKTAQTVIAHTAKYNDAYSTIDKFMDGFWECLPYICFEIIFFTIFCLISIVFKYFVFNN